MKGLGKRINEFKGLSLDSGNPLLLAQMSNFFAFVLVVKDLTLQSQLISNNKSKKAKDLDIRGCWIHFNERSPRSGRFPFINPLTYSTSQITFR